MPLLQLQAHVLRAQLLCHGAALSPGRRRAAAGLGLRRPGCRAPSPVVRALPRLAASPRSSRLGILQTGLQNDTPGGPRSPHPDWPPPAYLPMAQSSSHHSDAHQPLLCSPCGQLPSVYLQYRALLAEAQRPSEDSPVQPGAGLLPGVPAGAPEPPELPVAQRRRWRGTPGHGGLGPLAAFSVPSSPGHTEWRPHLLPSGCLQGILRAVSSLSRWAADCWATVLDL